MSKSERLNKELDLLIKMVMFLMAVVGAIIAYAYINKDAIPLIATGVPISILWYFYHWIKRDLDKLEKED